jgi:hypothetical protein
MSGWLRPILGAALLSAGAGGLAYKVISGYQHASPDAFVSVNDRNRPPAASPVDHPTPAATVTVDAAAPAQSAASDAETAPIAAAPPAASANSAAVASRGASSVALPEAQDDPACLAIKAEQGEIQRALKKQYSPEQGRFMQRRLRELVEHSVKLKCAE